MIMGVVVTIVIVLACLAFFRAGQAGSGRGSAPASSPWALVIIVGIIIVVAVVVFGLGAK